MDYDENFDEIWAERLSEIYGPVTVRGHEVTLPPDALSNFMEYCSSHPLIHAKTFGELEREYDRAMRKLSDYEVHKGPINELCGELVMELYIEKK